MSFRESPTIITDAVGNLLHVSAGVGASISADATPGLSLSAVVNAARADIAETVVEEWLRIGDDFLLAEGPAGVGFEGRPIISVAGDVIGFTVAVRHSLSESTGSLNPAEVLRQVIAVIPAAITWQSRDGILLGCNDRAARFGVVHDSAALVGLPLHEAFGRPADEEWNREDPRLIDDDRSVLARREEFVMGEHVLATEISKVPLRLSGDSPDALLTMSLDRSAEAAAERRLIDEQEVLQQIVDAVPALIAWKDRDRRFLGCNRAFSDHYGIAFDEVIGTTCSDLPGWTEERSADAAAEDERVMADGAGVHQRPEVWQRADGEIRHTDLSLIPLGPTGKATGLLTMSIDSTDRRRLEEKILESSRLESIGQLASGIAHEMNSPIQFVADNTRFLRSSFADLTLILSRLVELVSESGAAADAAPMGDLFAAAEASDLEFLIEEIPIAIDQTLEGIERVATIVAAMKDGGQVGPDAQQLGDLNELVTRVVAVTASEWRPVAHLETRLAEDLPAVPLIQGDTEKALINIIVNAAQAVADVSHDVAGNIVVSTCCHGDHAEIHVSDTGSGIPAEVGSRVFDPFFTTKDVGKGTGQGLSFAYNVIVQRHNGDLSFESKLGAGTTFVVRLPLESPTE